MLSDDDDRMLKAVAKVEGGLSDSETVRRLIRRAFAERGLTAAATPFQDVWDAFEREHLLFRERLRRSVDKGTMVPEARALKQRLAELSEMPLPSAFRKGNLVDAAERAYKAQIDAIRQNAHSTVTRAEPLERFEGAFEKLRALFDDLIDELKARR